LTAALRATLPSRIPSRGQLADFVIGHGGVAVSPVEVAMAMASLGNGQYRPRVRLVTETRDQQGRVVSTTPVVQENRLEFAPEHLNYIHQAMYSVVNHRDGTGRDAHLDKTRVHGKTGTAQWRSRGAIVNAVWFAGFVKDCDPPLAFAVAVEGKKGERIVGGKAAAPVAGEMLAQIFADPARYGLRASGKEAPWELELLINKGLMPGGRDTVPAISASGYSAWFPQPAAPPVKKAAGSALR
jgi:cell division protein FtsI/penicillin-binding protein 2